MTTDELKKEAEEYFKNLDKSRTKELLIDAYVSSAEPREKRIEELIALINAERERQEECDDVHLRKIEELEKENAELKADNDARKFAMAMSEKVEKQLRNERNTFLAQNEQYEKDLINFNNNLTKAKTVLRNVIDYLGQFCSDYPDCVIEAEQFIKDNEVKK